MARIAAAPAASGVKLDLFHGLAVFWLAAIVASAIAPVNPVVWLLENALTLVATFYLVLTRRTIPLSRAAYVCCAIFLALHEIGAHYTYMRVPVGAWVEHVFGLPRNDYDRLVHFAFGLLVTLPFRETLVRFMKAPGWFTYVFPVLLILALSSGYEILEARVVAAAPDAGTAFLAMQGDLFDSQADMACAMAGSIICMTTAAVLNRRAGSR
ncbi:MAG: DUF2238 domain-containing protein [Acidobacteriia bacterium]|nr:DUF2238 domain-containing protein [Terriglobia bacterium]